MTPQLRLILILACVCAGRGEIYLDVFNCNAASMAMHRALGYAPTTQIMRKALP